MRGSADFIKVFDINKPIVGAVVAHAARIFIDHLAHLWNALPNFHQLVYLLLVVAENKRNVHVIDELGNFVGQTGLIDAGRNSADGLSANGYKQQLRNVVADQCQLVALFDAQLVEPQRDFAHVVVKIVPGVVFPVAEIFLAQGNLVSGLINPPAQQLRNAVFKEFFGVLHPGYSSPI